MLPSPASARPRRLALAAPMLAVLLATLLTGCAMHTGPLPKAPPFPTATWKPSIAVQVERVYAETDATGWSSANRASRTMITKPLLRAREVKDQVRLLQRLQASGLFSRVVSMRRNDQLPPAANELEQMARLSGTDISLIVEPDVSYSLVPPIDAAVVLFIIPVYQADKHQLAARARFAAPGSEHRYQFTDKMGTLLWLPLLPMMVTGQADRMTQELQDNLLDTLILRLYEDAAQAHRALPAPDSKAMPSPASEASAPLSPPGPAPAVSP